MSNKNYLKNTGNNFKVYKRYGKVISIGVNEYESLEKIQNILGLKSRAEVIRFLIHKFKKEIESI